MQHSNQRQLVIALATIPILVKSSNKLSAPGSVISKCSINFGGKKVWYIRTVGILVEKILMNRNPFAIQFHHVFKCQLMDTHNYIWHSFYTVI